jgi:hypothetical protein
MPKIDEFVMPDQIRHPESRIYSGYVEYLTTAAEMEIKVLSR